MTLEENASGQTRLGQVVHVTVLRKSAVRRQSLERVSFVSLEKRSKRSETKLKTNLRESLERVIL
jgi:hypothetical protein